MKQPFALYRLPHADHYMSVTQLEGEAKEFISVSQLDGQSGYVFAPFLSTPQMPVLLIRPDEVKRIPLPEIQSNPMPMTHRQDAAGAMRKRYDLDFASFHAHVNMGEFEKIVLARSMRIYHAAPLDHTRLFLDACATYPRMMIALVSIPQAGTWLMATPEILLEGELTQWHTVALAGTMPVSADAEKPLWDEKNIREQRLVCTYIIQSLEQFGTNIEEQGPTTVRAGHLWHLRSDFSFSLADDLRLGALLDRLHPTPAVCGLPKERARRFILDNEAAPREYYSGFCGPLRMGEEQTHLYVNLRCMHISTHYCQLFAGGGILPDSMVQKEWEETETKLDTMRRLLMMHQQ
ncbi:MAG: isochorismate synthase [Prevotella sp.]|nr:isochorismate synthase [Prevotella sp.]